MSFEMSCAQCGITLRLDESQVGSVICCPSCGQVMFVEQPPAMEPPRESVEDLIARAAQCTLVLPAAAVEPEPAVSLPGGESPAGAAAAKEAGILDLAAPGIESVEQQTSIFAPDDANVNPFAPADPAGGLVFSPFPGEAGPMSGPTAPTALAEPVAPSALAAEAAATGMPWDQPAAPPAPVAAEAPAVPEWMPGPEAAGARTESPVELDFTGGSGTPAGASADAAIAEGAPTERLFTSGASAAEPDPTTMFLDSTSRADAGFGAPAPVAASSFASRPARAPAKSPFHVGVMVAVYVCGMIAGYVVAKLMGGGPAKPSGPTLEYIRDDGVKQDKAKRLSWVKPDEKLPAHHLKTLGQTVTLEHLAVTGLEVQRRKIMKFRINPLTRERETEASQQECLVLRMVVRNKSSDMEFAAMDQVFVRPHNPKERPNYSFIELGDGSQIAMYELHRFSEYDIEGQSFDVLKPGQEQETIVVASEGSPELAKGKMIWRVQLRAGLVRVKLRDGKEQNYSYTTVVGFEFTPDKIRTSAGAG